MWRPGGGSGPESFHPDAEPVASGVRRRQRVPSRGVTGPHPAEGGRGLFRPGGGGLLSGQHGDGELPAMGWGSRQQNMSTHTAIRIDPATGLKTFDTRAEAVRPDRGQGLRRRRGRGPDDAPRPAARRRLQRRGAGQVPRVQGGRAGAPPTTWRWRASSPATSRTSTRREPVQREALTDECEILVVGAGFAGLLLWYKLRAGRLRRRPLLREGRRRRRHLVLEPLSGHRLRRRVLQLPAAAGGDGVLPDDEVRVGLRDLRVLPEDGREVRLLRPLPVPHRPSSRPSGTRTPGAGPSTPTAATPCGPGS